MRFIDGRYGVGSSLVAVMSWTPNDPKSFQLWGDFYTASDAAEFGRTYFPHRHRVVTLLNPRSERDLKTIPAYAELTRRGNSSGGRK